MFGGAAAHAPLKSGWKGALKISQWSIGKGVLVFGVGWYCCMVCLAGDRKERVRADIPSRELLDWGGAVGSNLAGGGMMTLKGAENVREEGVSLSLRVTTR